MWTKEQLQAINKSGSNIIVSAGAGSGKTAVLTQRVISKLKSGVDINKLLILTFTDAASQEMKERIREAISKEEGLERQLDLITNAYICTFDSFSLSIVKKYHYLLNIDSNVSIMDNNINIIETSNILDTIFDEYYQSDNELFKLLISDFCVKNDDTIKKGILSLFLKMDLLVEKDNYLDNYFINIMNSNYINKLYDEFECIVKNKLIDLSKLLVEFNGEKTDVTELIKLIKDIIENKKDISQFSEKITLPRMTKNTLVSIKELKKQIEESIDEIQEMIGNDGRDAKINCVLSTINNQKIIIEIIKELSNRINDFKKKTNTYTFIDIAKMAIQIIKDNEDIRNEIKYSLNEIMIDEYQDTSDIQEYFINMISNNNVYMVGDIKQSIYRFRNANPTLFQTKYENYGLNNGGIKIDLTNNFRSRKEVVDDINNIFSSLMTNKLGGANYVKDHIMNSGNIDYNKTCIDEKHNLDIIKYENNTYFKLTDSEIEAFIIAKDIKSKMENCYKVMDKKTKTQRNVRYNDFVILMENSKHFEMYSKVFNCFQIPLNINKDEKITDDYDIKVIVNILKLLVSKNINSFQEEEKYALVSILRSYLFEANDNDIFNMFYNNDFYNNDLYKIIIDIRSNLNNMSIPDVISEIDERFGIIKKATKITNIKKVLVHIEYLNNMSISLSDLGYTLEQFVLYLEEVFENDLKIEYKNKLMSVDNAVKIMTIHKSKGLEFSICYFPTLDTKFNFSDLSNDYIFNEKYGIMIPKFDNGKRDTFIKKMYIDHEKNEQISEEVRVLYVSLTRAREKMIFISKNKEENKKINYRSFNDFIFEFLDSCEKKYISDDEVNSFIEINKAINNISLNDISFNNNILNVNEIDIKKMKEEKTSFSKTINELIDKDKVLLLELGTKIHEALEKVDFRRKDFSYINIEEKYKHYITSFLDCDLLKNVCNGKVFKEYEFYDEQLKIKGSIDLMIEYDNYIDIIDYKLKHIDDNEYVKQLNGYKNYIFKKTGKKVNTYLYSLFDKKYIMV